MMSCSRKRSGGTTQMWVGNWGVPFLFLFGSLSVFAAGGGGNSGASTEWRAEIQKPSVTEAWLLNTPGRPRTSPIEIATRACTSTVVDQTRAFFNQIDEQISCLSQADQGLGKRAAN